MALSLHPDFHRLDGTAGRIGSSNYYRTYAAPTLSGGDRTLNTETTKRANHCVKRSESAIKRVEAQPRVTAYKRGEYGE